MSHNQSRQPPLELLRGFIAVGRRMSITLAARDMHLTQSAVSRQIAALESALGVRLFARHHRSLSFTAEGHRLFQVAGQAIAQIDETIGALCDSQNRKSVTITASIGTAALWLLPRLTAFQQSQPEIDVRVAANNQLMDLRLEGVDLAIRYCRNGNTAPGAIHLFSESVVPVAHPSLRQRVAEQPQWLSQLVLLEFDDPLRPWLRLRDWLDVAGMRTATPKSTIAFNQYDQVIQAALAGQGIALGRIELIQPMLKDARLAPLPAGATPSETGYGYWLLQAEAVPRPEVSCVAEWIHGEAMRNCGSAH